jgi:hypothetical protein
VSDSQEATSREVWGTSTNSSDAADPSYELMLAVRMLIEKGKANIDIQRTQTQELRRTFAEVDALRKSLIPWQ